MPGREQGEGRGVESLQREHRAVTIHVGTEADRATVIGTDEEAAVT